MQADCRDELHGPPCTDREGHGLHPGGHELPRVPAGFGDCAALHQLRSPPRQPGGDGSRVEVHHLPGPGQQRAPLPAFLRCPDGADRRAAPPCTFQLGPDWHLPELGHDRCPGASPRRPAGAAKDSGAGATYACAPARTARQRRASFRLARAVRPGIAKDVLREHHDRPVAVGTPRSSSNCPRPHVPGARHRPHHGEPRDPAANANATSAAAHALRTASHCEPLASTTARDCGPRGSTGAKTGRLHLGECPHW
mmetsp:Transcript_10268/g.29313  ORF Transcript_10268/g.29313 Transcript_10268/m.29313 type:complete len:253 (-) Transcript_10268:732-1490(-)